MTPDFSGGLKLREMRGSPDLDDLDARRPFGYWLRILETFKLQIRNTNKISKYKIHFDKDKISTYRKIENFKFRDFPKNYQNLVRRISAILEVLAHFPHFFRLE